MELVRDRIVAFHEFDVIKHYERVVHSAYLQVVIDFLLRSFLLSFISLSAALFLYILQFNPLEDLIIGLLLANCLLHLLRVYKFRQRAQSMTSKVLYWMVLYFLGEVLIA